MKVFNIPNIAQLVERPTVEDVEIGRSLVRIRVFGIIFCPAFLSKFAFSIYESFFDDPQENWDRVCDFFGVETNSISELDKNSIQELLVKKRVDPRKLSELNELLQSCEFARYTPSAMDGMKSDYEKAAAVIVELSKI